MCEKAARVNAALSRIMANMGGPRQSRRALLAKFSQSIIMYALPLWGPALMHQTYVRMVKLVFRLSAIRTASAIRTLSHEAVGVISGIMPPDKVAYELKRIYDRRECIGRKLW